MGERESRNTRSPRRLLSERVVKLQRYHALQATDQPWTRDRVHRLCRLLRCLPEELGALVAITPKQMGQWLRDDRIPPYVGLHFVMLERAYIEAKHGLKAARAVPVEVLCNESENGSSNAPTNGSAAKSASSNGK
jgi:hypothetical protein